MSEQNELLRDPDFEPLAGPRWQNRWQVIVPCVSTDIITGARLTFNAGDTVDCGPTWPSEAIARHEASLADDIVRSKGLVPHEYLGAFPVVGDA